MTWCLEQCGDSHYCCSKHRWYSLVSRVTVASLRPAELISWLPVSTLGAPVSACCVAVRAAIQFFHVCLFPNVLAVASVMCVVAPRYVINPPRVHTMVVFYSDLIGVMMSMQCKIALLPFVPVVVVLVVMLMTATVIVGARLLPDIVPGVVVMVLVSFFVSASIQRVSLASTKPASAALVCPPLFVA